MWGFLVRKTTRITTESFRGRDGTNHDFIHINRLTWQYRRVPWEIVPHKNWYQLRVVLPALMLANALLLLLPLLKELSDLFTIG